MKFLRWLFGPSDRVPATGTYIAPYAGLPDGYVPPSAALFPPEPTMGPPGPSGVSPDRLDRGGHLPPGWIVVTNNTGEDIPIGESEWAPG